jgi:hypothetical protein
MKRGGRHSFLYLRIYALDRTVIARSLPKRMPKVSPPVVAIGIGWHGAVSDNSTHWRRARVLACRVAPGMVLEL